VQAPSLRYRLAVLSRLLAAALGGYALATMVPVLIAELTPQPRAEAVATALLMSFGVYVGAVLWAFATRTLFLAWAGLLVPALLCGVAWWAIR
jgi:hypothetical protein